MSEFLLRAAKAGDAQAIRDLIHRVNINPFSLDWRRFILAVDNSDSLVGCGQLKPHGRSLIELASIAVQPEHQGQGIATAIIDRLLERAPRPLYLTCRGSMRPFYQKWGFQALRRSEMPPYFQRLERLAVVAGRLFGDDEGMLVMRLQ